MAYIYNTLIISIKRDILILLIIAVSLPLYSQTIVRVIADQPTKLAMSHTDTLVTKKNDTYYFGEKIVVSGGVLPYQYSWYKNNTIISNNQVLQLPTANASGTFTLIVKDAKNCSASVIATDNHDIFAPANNILVYPLPATEYIFIDPGNIREPIKAIILDSKGSVMLIKQFSGKSRIDFVLPPGIYFLRLETLSGKYAGTRKIIIS